MPDNRRNVQINQPGIAGNESVDKNGWPSPLNSPLDPLRVKVTNGSNGSQSYKTIMATSRQDELSLPEGNSNIKTVNQSDQGGHSNKLKTSQMNPPEHSQPGGE